MKRAIFSYLKRKGLTEIQMVNRLFVSAFMRHYNIMSHNNSLLMLNYIKDEDEDAQKKETPGTINTNSRFA